MILDENNELTAIAGKQRFRCKVDGCKHRACWLAEPVGGGEPITMCGWHVLYGGSKWGDERKDDIVHLGPMIQHTAMRTRTETTNVPKLDPRGRLPVEDCERFLLGVKKTTVTARRLMGRIRVLRSLTDADG